MYLRHPSMLQRVLIGSHVPPSAAENILPHSARKTPFRGCCPWPACCARPSRRRRRHRGSPGGPGARPGSRDSASCRATRAPWTARATAARPGTIRGRWPVRWAMAPAPRRTTSTVTPPCLHRCTPPRDTPPTLHPSAIRPPKVPHLHSLFLSCVRFFFFPSLP